MQVDTDLVGADRESLRDRTDLDPIQMAQRETLRLQARQQAEFSTQPARLLVTTQVVLGSH